jgi:heptosyltransferase-2
MHVAVFLPNWVGDVVMATPALRALRAAYPTARVTGVLRPYVAQVLAGTKFLDETRIYDPKSKASAERSWSVVRALRRDPIDMALLLTNGFRTAAMAWAAGARQRIGYRMHYRGKLLTHPVPAPCDATRRLSLPALDAYLQLAQHAGCSDESPRLELGTLPQDEQAADEVLQSFSWRGQPGYAVLNPGGAFGPAKLWPVEHFAILARRLADERGLNVLIHCGPSERELARRIAKLAERPQVASLADARLGLGLSKALVRRSKLLVTTDSGVRFFGAAFDVPVISLFGPTDASWSTIYYPRETCLQKPVPCGPCRQRECPLEHHRCMRDLLPEEVWQACRQALAAAQLAA